MRPRLEARIESSRVMVYATPVLAVILTMACGSVLFAALGHHPLAVLYAFFIQPISSAYGLAELTVKATPLVLCAIGLSFGFRANVWNIGAEGQLTLGAIAGGGIALWAGDDAGPWVLPAMIFAGLLGGAVWAAVPAFLKTRFN
ncbi:MAG: ABC transporter permease, partial [Alphaproteobacteria bacterium]|nr:ABC transporter permease [Alphaproteobacteria bacterium]